MTNERQGFLDELQLQARHAFLRSCPLFSTVVVAWTGFDALLAPDWWSTFLLVRLAVAAVSIGLFVASWKQWTERHGLLLLAWVLTIALGIAVMLPVVSTDVFPYYIMGYSLCVLGVSTFATMRPRDIAIALGAYLLLFVPTAHLRGWVTLEVVAAWFFLLTLCLAALFQAMQRFQAFLDGWNGRQELAGARDEALLADREKSSFLARMSHELRTPLNAIIGYAELVEEELEDPVAREDVGRIETAGRHLLALINDVLDLSKVAAGELDVRHEVVDLADCLAEVRPLAEKLADRRGNRLTWDVQPVEVHGDPLRIRQIALNLIANAAKFTDAGCIAVQVTHGPEGPAISVADDGIGMDAAQLQRAFLPFVQVHDDAATYGGTGLGLALSRQLADRLGGRLEAESTPGVGSRFTLVLSVA
jgi:signal transduction histidine kinase